MYRPKRYDPKTDDRPEGAPRLPYAEWRLIRRRILRQHALKYAVGLNCSRCGETGGPASMDVDHIVPVAKARQGPDGNWYTLTGIGIHDDDNLQVLCKRCHYQKTKEDFPHWEPPVTEEVRVQ